MPSDLSGVFNELTLNFEVGGTYGANAEGNPSAAEPSTLQVRCWLKVIRDPMLQQQEGAGQTVISLVGRCVEPAKLPPAVTAGMTSALTLKGREGTFTLSPRAPALLQEVEDSLGEKIVGVWRKS